MLKVWDLFWEMIAALLTNGKDAASNIGEGTVELTSAYKHGCAAINNVAKDLTLIEECITYQPGSLRALSSC